jgi:hypothetical protein
LHHTNFNHLAPRAIMFRVACHPIGNKLGDNSFRSPPSKRLLP